MAGKSITYRFGLRDVKERTLPEVNEELAQDLGHDGPDALRQSINDEILADRARLQESDLKNQVFEILVREHEFDPPESWVGASLERLQRQFGLQDEPQSRERLLPVARKWAKFDCLVTLIAGREQLSVTDQEIAEQVGRLAEELKKTPDEVAPLLDNPAYRNQALRDKVMKFLLDKAEIS
jgi:trigger factor